MTELLLLLSLWPFHHKPEGTDHHDRITFIHAEPAGCDKNGKLYFYVGNDSMTGISGASCEGAKDDWRTLHIDPVRMSRA